MGRAGGGGGGRSSGGGHSRSRSSGGHRVGGGSRAGSHRSYSSSHSFHSSSHHHHHHHHYGGGYRGGRTVVYRESSPLSTVLAFLFVFLIILIGLWIRWDNQPKSTINREKLTDIAAFDNACVVDEIQWFDNAGKAGKSLKYFWEQTGVQPYIVLRDYDPNLTTDAQKEQFCVDYYDKYIEEENAFLYMYFAEKDVDDDVGYMAYANGYRTSSIMDSEAMEIFWNNLDSYWYTDMSTDDLFERTFTKTADTIMRVSTTGADLLKYIIIFVGIIGAGLVAIKVIGKKRQAEKERAEETQAILNTPISEIKGHDSADELAKKYE